MLELEFGFHFKDDLIRDQPKNFIGFLVFFLEAQ